MDFKILIIGIPKIDRRSLFSYHAYFQQESTGVAIGCSYLTTVRDYNLFENTHGTRNCFKKNWHQNICPISNIGVA